jgi:hypothetical protein
LEALAVNGHKLQQLQRINLTGNNITDGGLEALAVNGHKFLQLRAIDLGGNSIDYRYFGKYLAEIFPLKEF